MSKKSQQNGINEPIIVKEILSLVHKFTDLELKEISENLAHEIQEKEKLENEKKSVTSSFKAQIDARDTSIQMLAGKISSKEEDRDVECEVTMNDPKPGRKTARRVDNGQVVWEQKMTPEDLQVKMNLEEEVF